MKTKEIVAGVAGGIILFALGGIIYVLLFADFFASAIDKDPAGFPFIVGGEVVMGILLAWVLSRFGISNVADGAKNGAIFGAIAALGMGLIMYGAYDMYELSQHLADVVVWAVRYGAAGAVIGWLLGRGTAAAS